MVAEEIIKLREEIPEGISLVAVSKFHPASMIREAYDVGQRLFGESRVQELLEKIPLLPEDIEWHFIGHLQTNKVRQLIGKVALIESVDSEKLLAPHRFRVPQGGVVTNVLMQVHVAAEETKFGFLPEELMSYFKDKRFENLTNTHICGSDGYGIEYLRHVPVRADFAEIRRIFRRFPEDNSLGLRGFDRVSMGMSHDWRIAVEEGSTSVRIGKSYFR